MNRASSDRSFLITQHHVTARQLRAAGLGDPLEHGHHPVFDRTQLGPRHRIPRLVGPDLHRRSRVGVVRQPVAYPDPLPGPAEQCVSARALIDIFGDPGQDADVAARIVAADLAAAGDQHDAERFAAVEAVPHQRTVAGLENAQRQIFGRAAEPTPAGTSPIQRFREPSIDPT